MTHLESTPLRSEPDAETIRETFLLARSCYTIGAKKSPDTKSLDELFYVADALDDVQKGESLRDPAELVFKARFLVGKIMSTGVISEAELQAKMHEDTRA